MFDNEIPEAGVGKGPRRWPLRLLGLVAVSAVAYVWLDGTTPRVAPDSVPANTVAQSATAAATATADAPAKDPSGWVDQPVEEAVVGKTVTISGWALDASGIDRVEMHVDGKIVRARYGIPRADVAVARPGFPDSQAAGFSGEITIDDALVQRRPVEIVAISRGGEKRILGRRSIIPPTASTLWEGVPGLARRDSEFAFLMALSGVALGGALELDTQYRPYLTKTPQIGMAVPILYLRTTRGAQGDWTFDPDFDLTRKCGERRVVDDNLNAVINWAIEKRIPVQFSLNGGIWGDASCDIPQWDVNDHLEQDPLNCQWDQNDTVLADGHMKGLVGSQQSPELGRSLTYHVYATDVRKYKRRNLQAAARVVAQFARKHPDLFVGVNLDADTYMNPFPREGRRYDYNPGMLRQFREWLSGTGPYAGRTQPGVPDLTRYRRVPSLTLGEVNALARQSWSRWDEVQPPRRFLEAPEAASLGVQPYWLDAWYLEWDGFRRHIVGLHYSELSEWVHEAGIDRERIFSAQAFIRPDPGFRPVATHVRGESPNYDSAGVSIEGAVPTAGHLGAILYGPAAENDHRLANGHSLFATIARMDPSWGVVEMNATDLKAPNVPPTYSRWYRSFRELFNYDAKLVATMAWNGWNGLFANDPAYQPYTSWRNTVGESAMRDFLVTHANLPRGARLWSFGVPGYLDDDGWYLEDGGLVYARGGYLDLAWKGREAVLRSPADQVIRPTRIQALVLGFPPDSRPSSLRVQARLDGKSRWRDIGGTIPGERLVRTNAGWRASLPWPAEWRNGKTIVTELRIAAAFDAGRDEVRLDRIALVPTERPAP